VRQTEWTNSALSPTQPDSIALSASTAAIRHRAKIVIVVWASNLG